MIFTLTARHFKAHDSLKDFAAIEAEKLTKYFEGVTRVEVILSYEKPVSSVKTAEILLHAKPQHNFTAKESTDDFKLSMEAAFGKIAVQLKKYKEKLNDHHIAAKAVNSLRNSIESDTDLLQENGEQTEALETEAEEYKEEYKEQTKAEEHTINTSNAD